MRAPTRPNLLIDLFRARIKEIDAVLAELDTSSSTANASALEEDLIFAGAELMSAFRAIVRSQGGSARDRILRYLQAHVGEIIDGEVLATIAGISEWARRVRELDVEYGYRIATHETDPHLRPSQYRLEWSKPDADRALWWRLKKSLRACDDLPQEKALHLLQGRIGRPVDKADLHYVLEPAEPGVIVEYLQFYEGWQISTCLNRADLTADQYVLETEKLLSVADRIDGASFQAVLRRDGFICRNCRWHWLGQETPMYMGRYLTVHRCRGIQLGLGLDDYETLCNCCCDERNGITLGEIG